MVAAASAVAITTATTATTATTVTTHSIPIAIAAFFAAFPFSLATWFVLFILGFFIWLFYRANQDPKSPVDWQDLILDSDTGKVSPYRVGYLVGVIVSTWIIIEFADAPGAVAGTSKLTYDMFGLYLLFLVGGVIGVTAVKKPAAQVQSTSNTNSTTQ